MHTLGSYEGSTRRCAQLAANLYRVVASTSTRGLPAERAALKTQEARARSRVCALIGPIVV